MITISLCMIVKNEEDVIGNCLASVKDVVDEIIIVDTGSTDQTKKIVSEFTDKIYDFEWIDDFAAARNYSFQKATKDYILWLDADDILLPEDAAKLKELKSTLAEDISCVQFYYNYAFDESGHPTLSFLRERLVKRSYNFKWVGFIHEYINAPGPQINADIYVTHRRVHVATDRNLNIFEKKRKEGAVFTARDYYYYGKELFYHAKWDDCIRELKKSIAMPCWIEDRLDAMYIIADCYQYKQEYHTARDYLFHCFEYALPRAECLYRIGKLFQLEEKYEQAIYWYELIFQTKRPASAGFVFEEYWTWKPHLELCVCYYQMGDRERSILHNEEAAKYVPDNVSVLHNQKYFKENK